MLNSATLTGLTSLQSLRLDSNKITRVEENLFRSLVKLSVLNLESNELVSFNKNALIGLSKLEALCLYNNPISYLIPDQLNDVFSMNKNCKVYTTTRC